MNNKSLFDISSLNPVLTLKEYENILSKNKSKEAAFDWLNKSIHSYYKSECGIYNICTIVELLFRDGYITLTDIFSILRNYHCKPYYDSSIFRMIIKHIMTIHSNNSSLTEEYYIKILEFYNDNILGIKFIDSIGYIEIKQCSNISKDDLVKLYTIMDNTDQENQRYSETRFEYYNSFNISIILLLVLDKRFDTIQHICKSYYILKNVTKLDRNVIISLLENVDITFEVPHLINYCNEHCANDADLVITILSKYWYKEIFDRLDQSFKDSLKKSNEFKKLILKKGELIKLT